MNRQEDMHEGYALHKIPTNKALPNMNSQSNITEHINKSTMREIQQTKQTGYRPIRERLLYNNI